MTAHSRGFDVVNTAVDTPNGVTTSSGSMVDTRTSGPSWSEAISAPIAPSCSDQLAVVVSLWCWVTPEQIEPLGVGIPREEPGDTVEHWVDASLRACVTPDSDRRDAVAAQPDHSGREPECAVGAGLDVGAVACCPVAQCCGVHG